MTDWQPIETAPAHLLVETKIDDGKGVRNEQPMVRSGGLWFVEGMGMYVYYTPSHWREIQ